MSVTEAEAIKDEGRSMVAALRRPLIALVLGLMPSVVFVGVSNTVTVNGELLRDDRLNILGIVLAIAGLALAVTSLRPPGAFGALRKALAIVALLVCGVQLAASAGLVSPRQLVASLLPAMIFSKPISLLSNSSGVASRFFTRSFAALPAGSLIASGANL